MKFGIMGAASIAPRFIEAVKKVKGAEVTAIASRSFQKAIDFAKRHQIDTAFGKYEDLCRSPEIDAVYIATTMNCHFDNVMLCISHGKHVLCEKPMFLTEEEGKKAYEAARKADVFLMEGLWSLFLPPIKRVRELIEQDAIGEVAFAESRFAFYKPYDPEHRLFRKSLGGGALYDLGVYNIAVSSFLFDELPETASGKTILSDSGVDMMDTVSLKFPSGRLAQFSCGFLYDMDNSMTVYGSKGKIVLKDRFLSPNCLELWQGKEKIQVFDFEECGFEFEISEAVDCIKKRRKQSKVHPVKSSIAYARVFDLLLKQWDL